MNWTRSLIQAMMRTNKLSVWEIGLFFAEGFADNVYDEKIYFQDSIGRRWNAWSWLNTYINDEITREINDEMNSFYDEFNHDLVLINYYGDCAPQCRQYQNRVFSRSGTNPDYPSLESATAEHNAGQGLWHHNCRHRTYLYVPGVIEPEKNVATEEEMDEAYKKSQIRSKSKSSLDPKKKPTEKTIDKRLKETNVSKSERDTLMSLKNELRKQELDARTAKVNASKKEKRKVQLKAELRRTQYKRTHLKIGEEKQVPILDARIQKLKRQIASI